MAANLEYAFKSERDHSLVHVSAVATGLACACICPQCESQLVAKNNPLNKRVAHFQHYQTSECDQAVETSLHLLAKEVLDQSRQMMLPGFKERFVVKDKKYRGYGPLLDEEKEFLKSELVTLEDVKIEIYQEGIKPDLLVWVNGEPVMVEIYVTHKVDPDKLKRIKKKEIPAIEIDLHTINRTISREDLKSILMSGEFSKWIHSPIIDLARQDYQLDIEEKVKNEQTYRDQDFAVIQRKRDRKKHKAEYLDKAKNWCRSKSDRQLLGTETKHGYSIFKRVSDVYVENCPIARNKSISSCLFCEYNARFDSASKKRFITKEDEDIGFIKCLYDLMKDRYYNQEHNFNSP